MIAEGFFWMIVFLLSALLFFAIAAVVITKGVGDLRNLLQHTKKN
jgi:hypothetical protein